MRNSLIGLLVVMCVCCRADGVTLGGAQARVESEFQRIIASRQKRLVQKPAQPRLNDSWRSSDPNLVYDNHMTRLKDTAALLGLLPNVDYRRAVIAELKSANPAYRGLACELLGFIFDLRALQEVSKLLDDQGDCLYSEVSVAQTGPAYVLLQPRKVGEVALGAMNRMIGMHFRSKSSFDFWWKSNSKHQDKIWYWRARWLHEAPRYRDEFVGLEKTPDLGASDVEGALSSLPTDTQLKILLLAARDGALEDEARWTVGDKYREDGVWPGMGGSPAPAGLDSKLIAKFVQEHRLKGRLIELLQQKAEIPGASFDRLAPAICNLGTDVFSSEDEPALAAAQVIVKPHKPPVSELVLLRVQLVPERRQAILRETLSNAPDLAEVALALTNNLGPDDADALVKSFQAADQYSQRTLADRAKTFAGKASGIDLALIHRLAGSLSDPPAGNVYTYFDPAKTLCALAGAANTVSGRTLISDEAIKAATPIHYKGNPTDAENAHNANLPQAMRSLKAELLAAT